MINYPLSGVAEGCRASDGEVIIVDGAAGLVTRSPQRSEYLLPAITKHYTQFGCTAALCPSGTDASAVAMMGNSRRVRISFPAQSCSPGQFFVGGSGIPEIEALKGQARPEGGFNKRVPIPRCTHAVIEYGLRFPVGFDWRGGGKLPGFASRLLDASGGVTNPAISGTVGFSARMMWRPLGRVEPYLYMADNEGRWASQYKGSNIGSADIRFTPGQWDKIRMEVWLNTPGQMDGGCTLTLNGVTVADRRDLIYRNNGNLFIDTLFLSSFFGGNTTLPENDDSSIWFTPVDTYCDITDIVLTILK